MRSVLPPLAVPTQTILILCCTVNPPPQPPFAHPTILPLRLTYLPNSAFQSLLSSQDLTYLYTADDGEGWIHSDRFEANFPIAILDRLLSQVSK